MAIKHMPRLIIWSRCGRLCRRPKTMESRIVGSYHPLDLPRHILPGGVFHRHLYDPTRFLHYLTKILCYLPEPNHLCALSSGLLATVAAAPVPSKECHPYRLDVPAGVGLDGGAMTRVAAVKPGS